MFRMVRINTEVLELFLYFWEAVNDKEKVGEAFLADIATRKEMSVLFSEDFDGESVRRVLSSIANREILSDKTKAEGRFWNNNMWMLEDLSLTREMLAPVKQLNGEQFAGNLSGDLLIYFIPGHLDTYYKTQGELYINFFKLMFDYGTGEVMIDGLPLVDFIKSVI